jgi:hypothetical protein
VCGFLYTDPALKMLRSPSMSDGNLITVSKSKSQRDSDAPRFLGGGAQKQNHETALKRMKCRTLSLAFITKFRINFRTV